MKKIIDKNISITTVSEKTIVTIDGKQVSIDGFSADNNLMALLKNNNLDSNMIAEILQATENNTQNISNNTSSERSTKIECNACNRTVSYGIGRCMYCGNILAVQKTEQKNKASNTVDEKYLNTEKINTENKTSNADLNYIDRLKDI